MTSWSASAAVMSKVAAKKTVGLLGDDLAVNAEKATGFHASRELPVIWAITRGSFLNKLIMQVLVVSLIALLATVGVYGLVALLVRMDDAGGHLLQRAAELEGGARRLLQWAGRLLIGGLPRVIRVLGVIGTIAMLLVGGGMYVRNIALVHHALAALPALAAELLAGLVVGGVLLAAIQGGRALLRGKAGG